MNTQFKQGDKAVIPVKVTRLHQNYADVQFPNGDIVCVGTSNLTTCFDAIPSLAEQEEMVNAHLRVQPTPTREEVLRSNIEYNEKRIAEEWTKSEPNIDRINMLSRFVNENKLELINIQSVKN